MSHKLVYIQMKILNIENRLDSLKDELMKLYDHDHRKIDELIKEMTELNGSKETLHYFEELLK